MASLSRACKTKTNDFRLDSTISIKTPQKRIGNMDKVQFEEEPIDEEDAEPEEEREEE